MCYLCLMALMSSRLRFTLITDIISGSVYLPKATVFATSRPSATAQLQSLFQTSIGKHVEIVGCRHQLQSTQTTLTQPQKITADFAQYCCTEVEDPKNSTFIFYILNYLPTCLELIKEKLRR